MHTDCAITRMSSDWVVIRPIVNRMTDRRLWKYYLPLRSVIAVNDIDGKKSASYSQVFSVTELVVDPV